MSKYLKDVIKECNVCNKQIHIGWDSRFLKGLLVACSVKCFRLALYIVKFKGSFLELAQKNDLAIIENKIPENFTSTAIKKMEKIFNKLKIKYEKGKYTIIGKKLYAYLGQPYESRKVTPHFYLPDFNIFIFIRHWKKDSVRKLNYLSTVQPFYVIPSKVVSILYEELFNENN